MRPASLDPLFAEAASLKGIGKRTAQTLARLAPPPTLPGTDKVGAARIIDLLLLWPHRIIDRGNRPAIGDIVPGTLVTLEVTIAANPPVARGASRRPHKITVFDDTGELDLVFFHGQGRYLHKLAAEGSIR
ncbi:MAG: ATP-dependent DNA helicase RecG, partial [Hyphomicrobiales bacterium]